MSHRADRHSPCSILGATVVAALLWPSTSRAQDAAPAAPNGNGGPNGTAHTPEEKRPIVVRIALSKTAAEKLSEQRVRRLVELQVGAGASVPSEATGPLDENAVRVYIDLPEPTVVVVQVQAPDRRLETRNVDVAGLPWEVATRFVATAASQSISALTAPRRKPRPRPPSPEEVARELAKRPWLEVSAGLEAVYSSDLETALFGSRVRLGYHGPILSEAISLAALGSIDAGLWTEVDVSAFHRIWIGPDVRVGLGFGFALAFTKDLRREEELAAPASDNDVELWVRPHALASIDFRLAPEAWLRAGVDPGATIDPNRDQVGLWLGGTVALGYEGW
ncbi:MAG: hypothetical protein HOW73_29945 [Polyangiaceae bacterium]|nr:hypothetical protein [Polyangiaceae bacterium]